MPLLTPDEVRAALPCVGERLVKKPTYYHGFLSRHDEARPKPCTVVYVHRRNMWYTVEFDNGNRESYKLPEVKVGPDGRLMG